MKTKLLVIIFSLTFYLGKAQDYKLYDNFIYKDLSYELRLKNNEVTKSYKVMIFKADDKKQESLSFIYDYDESLFIKSLSEMMKKIDANFDLTTAPELKTKWVSIYNKLIKEINKKEVITESYDSQPIEYSGVLKLKETISIKYGSSEKEQQQFLKKTKKELKKTDNTLSKVEINTKAIELVKNKKKAFDSLKTFTPKTASVRFYNNRINSIAVVGTIDTIEYTIRNNKFSVPFRFLNNNKEGSFLKIYIDGIQYLMNWDDLLDYNNFEEEFSFTVKNKNYKLKVNEDVKIESRNLFDYFTAIIFSDFLGLNNTGGNSLLLAEGRVIIPLALVNKSQHNLINYFEGYLTTSLYNGQEEGNNYVSWKSKAANNNIADKIILFDFFKKRNIETGLNFGIYTFEWKGISTNITLDYGVQFYRTKLRYFKDALNNYEDYQVYTIGHGPKLKFEIRPQVNFGADLNIGLIGYNFNGMNTSNELRSELKKIIEDKPTFLNGFYIVSNFYTKLNDKEANNGLYFRLGAFYDFNTSDIAPQVMVGYATNLTSFINKFKKKDEVTTVSTTSKL